MDNEIGILLVLIAFAFGCFVAVGISEERENAKNRDKEEIRRQKREDRVNKLFGRS